MAARALIHIDPNTARLQAFVIESVTQELEKNLKENAAPSIGGQPAGDVFRKMAANLREAANKAEKEFQEHEQSRKDRKERKNQRRQFTGADFDPTTFGQVGVGAGGGQTPPGVPPPPTAEELKNKDFSVDDSL
jgi:hypothetical protein